MKELALRAGVKGEKGVRGEEELRREGVKGEKEKVDTDFTDFTDEQR